MKFRSGKIIDNENVRTKVTAEEGGVDWEGVQCLYLDLGSGEMDIPKYQNPKSCALKTVPFVQARPQSDLKDAK